MNETTTARRHALIGLSLASVAALTACAAPPAAVPADTRAADEAVLLQTDANWSKAAQARQVDAWMAFYTNDAIVMPPGSPPVSGKESIAKLLTGLFGLPGFSIAWKADRAEIARFGDLGFVYGGYDVSFRNPKGKPVKEHGKYVVIWRKQADGSWKCAIDMWNADAAG